MATKKEVVKICDICEKRVVTGGQLYISGHPFNGWFAITQHGGSTTLHELRKKREWDICSEECLAKFAGDVDKYQNAVPFDNFE